MSPKSLPSLNNPESGTDLAEKLLACKNYFGSIIQKDQSSLCYEAVEDIISKTIFVVYRNFNDGKIKDKNTINWYTIRVLKFMARNHKEYEHRYRLTDFSSELECAATIFTTPATQEEDLLKEELDKVRAEIVLKLPIGMQVFYKILSNQGFKPRNHAEECQVTRLKRQIKAVMSA